jgi:Bifunctional DNA primase/polymerase, N-terminal
MADAVSSAGLDAAQWLARSLRLPVFPCIADPGSPHDKKPATRHGFYNATTDPDRIRRFFWSGRLIGVPTGAVTGLVILDIDERHNGHLWERANARRLKPTRVHRTQSGGRHYLFQHPGEGERIRCTAGDDRRIAPGVDVRGDGGYAIWWPLHGCEVMHPMPLDRLAAWPAWIDALRAKPVITAPLTPPMPGDEQGASRARSWGVEALKIAIRKVAAAPVGTRNHTLNAMTYMLGEYIHIGAVDVEEVVEAMAIAARTSGQEESEITKTITSALSARGV